jgi:glycosyltransferase involved in cell wall biosynthesis
MLARWLLHKLRIWDSRTAHGVDAFVANSHFIARRILKTYGREAQIIHPPVDVEAIKPGGTREDFYLTASRLVPYKQVSVLVEAFASLPDRRLVVIGDGPELARLRAAARPNVTLLGYQDTATLHDYLRRARAFVYAAREDFGIVLAEAQAAGAPVIAYARGGAADIVRGLEVPNPTGILFEQQTPSCVAEAIGTFEREERRIRPQDCRANAERFGIERFRGEMRQFVDSQWNRFSREVLAAPSVRLTVDRTTSDDSTLRVA